MVGFRILLAGFRIPKPWIPDSTDQNYLDSGFRIPDYLTWGETIDVGETTSYVGEVVVGELTRWRNDRLPALPFVDRTFPKKIVIFVGEMNV